jgi:hypothetical protein
MVRRALGHALAPAGEQGPVENVVGRGHVSTVSEGSGDGIEPLVHDEREELQ